MQNQYMETLHYLFNAVANNYQEITNYLKLLTTDKNIKAAVDKYRNCKVGITLS